MVFESTFTLTVLGLMILFVVLWIVSIQRNDGKSQLENLTQQLQDINLSIQKIGNKMSGKGTEPLENLSQHLQGINLSLHGIGNKMSGMRSAKERPQTPLTVDTVKRILRDHGFVPEVSDPEDPSTMYFFYNSRRYRLQANGLPYITIGLVFGLKPEEEDLELLGEASIYVSKTIYGVTATVFPVDDKLVVAFNSDIYADTDQYLHKHIRFFVEAVDNAGRYFFGHYCHLREEKSAQEVFNGAWFAGQNEQNGKKLIS